MKNDKPGQLVAGIGKATPPAVTLFAALFAVTAGTPVIAESRETITFGGTPDTVYFVKLALALIVVLFIFICLAKLLRQMNGFGTSASGAFRPLATLSLGNRERLLIIKAGNTQLLIAVSSSGISKIHTFDEDIEPLLRTSDTSRGSFPNHLQQVLGNLQK